MSDGFELRVLGAIEVRRDGVPIPIGGPKPRLLLALLLAHRGGVVSTDRCCDELWGDAQPSNPAGVLQSHISRLRALLRPDAEIVMRPPGYVLHVSDENVDAGRFEQACVRASGLADPQQERDVLDAALSCWHGSALEEFADLEWGRRESVRLNELRAKAQEDLFDARLALGEHGELVGELEAFVAEHPLRERPWRQLIVALYRCGRSGEALRRATAFRSILRDELGLEPSPDLRELEGRVLTDDPTLQVPAATIRPSRPRRLPTYGTELVGRDVELEELMEQLDDHRLVTLTGAGGAGKTRFALWLATKLWDQLDGEVFFVELAPVQDPAAAVAAVAAAVDVQPRQHLSIEETLVEHLRARRAWLVLDNCEHVLGAISPLVERLLRWCADLRVLATSREVLGLPGEKVWRVGPLEMAEPGAAPAAISDAPAVRLFVERAAAARAGFALGPENIDAVAEVVRRVDALPLGIELAAARIRAMSPAALAERLDRHYDVLDGARSSTVPRHRTLHDLVAWSYDLLEPDERQLFARLSVFVGSFDLDSAEAIGGHCEDDEAKTSILLANLVDKSMVQLVDEQHSRYRLLETLRQYGDAQLATVERDALRAQHARWFLDRAERWAKALAGPEEAAAVAAIDRDFDNLRAAQLWAVEHDDSDVALRLVAAMREYSFRVMRAEIITWADDAIRVAGAETHHRAPVVLAVSAYGRFVRGDLEGAIALGERAVAVAQDLGADSSGLAERALGNAWFYRGDVDRATEWMDRMVDSARRGSDARLAHALYMRSVAFTSVGDTVKGAQLAGEASAAARSCGSPTAQAQAAYAIGLALESSDPVEAMTHLQRTFDVAHAAGNRWIEAFALTEVLWLQARQSSPREALARYAEVVDIWYRGGDWVNQWLSLRHVFGILVQLRADVSAATLHGALTAAGAAYALPFEAADAEHLAGLVDELRERLGPAAFASAVRTGAALSDAEIVELARDQIGSLAGEVRDH